MIRTLAFLGLFGILLHAQTPTGIYATFEVQAVQDASLTLPIAGVVKALYAEVGDHKKKGEILLELRNEEQKERVAMAKAELEMTRQQYLFSKAQFERYERSQSVIEKNTFERIAFEYKSKEEELKRAQKSLAYANEILDQTILRTPFEGIIAQKSVEVGDGISANSTKAFRLISPKRKLLLLLDSKHLGRIALGDSFVYSLDGVNYNQSAPLIKIYPTVDPKTRKAQAEALIEGLEPGIFGDGYIKGR